jgi:hypothetical protein
MTSPRKARAGLLLLLMAGPFLVFLFLHLFGKNHFELDRYPAASGDFLAVERKISAPFFLMDTALYGNKPAALKSQFRRLDAFWEDLGKKPEILMLDVESSQLLKAEAKDWFFRNEAVEVQSVKGLSKKTLPNPPRAFLFDEAKTLRGIYGLCSNKSVDTLMLEYRILISD